MAPRRGEGKGERLDRTVKVVYSKEFTRVYTSDPAAAKGRMESIVSVIEKNHDFVPARPATEAQIARAHSGSHIESVRRTGFFQIAALAAGGSVEAARIGLGEPAFGLVRPPGHHASRENAWGFCYFNNMSIALLALKHEGLIRTAFVLDFDLHYGDGNVNIMGDLGWVEILNPSDATKHVYMAQVEKALSETTADIIGISAGFDNHEEDWGGLLHTEDYRTMGRWVRAAAARSGSGCFGILEGGYNHEVLGRNVDALLSGMSSI